MMKRRDLLIASTSLPFAAQAQAFQEGKHYRRLQPSVPGPADGRIEVVEFFSYGCPACYAFEPALNAWSARLPAHVAFRHQAHAWNALTTQLQRLWFALNAMGVEHQFRSSVFAAVHVQRQMLDTPQSMLKLLKPLGLDEKRFQSTWDSFDAKAFSGARIAAAARQALERYRITGVPTLAVGGRFLVSPSEASEGRAESSMGASALRVADQLITSLKAA